MFALPSLFLPKIFTESSPIPEPSFSWDKHRGAVPWFIHELSQEGFPAVPEALENSCSEQPWVHTEGGSTAFWNSSSEGQNLLLTGIPWAQGIPALVPSRWEAWKGAQGRNSSGKGGSFHGVQSHRLPGLLLP